MIGFNFIAFNLVYAYGEKEIPGLGPLRGTPGRAPRGRQVMTNLCSYNSVCQKARRKPDGLRGSSLLCHHVETCSVVHSIECLLVIN